MFSTIFDVLFMRMYGVFYEYTKSKQDKLFLFLALNKAEKIKAL